MYSTQGLRLLAKLTLVNKECRDVVAVTVEHAVLRLAQFDLVWEWFIIVCFV